MARNTKNSTQSTKNASTSDRMRIARERRVSLVAHLTDTAASMSDSEITAHAIVNLARTALSMARVDHQASLEIAALARQINNAAKSTLKTEEIIDANTQIINAFESVFVW